MVRFGAAALLWLLSPPRSRAYSAEEDDLLDDPDDNYREIEDDADLDDEEPKALSQETVELLHSKVDLNNDGKISMKEILTFSSIARRTFAHKDVHILMEEMDKNHDSKLSLREYLEDLGHWDDDTQVHPLRDFEEQKFRLCDVDGDGSLDLEELPVLFYPELKDDVLRLTSTWSVKDKDKNADKFLTLKEFLGDEPEPAAEDEEEFRNLDVDGDGFLNEDEMMAWESGQYHVERAMHGLFQVADEDSDGRLSLAELDSKRQGLWESIVDLDAHDHLLEWAESADEL